MVTRNKAGKENRTCWSRGGGLFAIFSRLVRKVQIEKVALEPRYAGGEDPGMEALRQWKERVQGPEKETSRRPVRA